MIYLNNNTGQQKVFIPRDEVVLPELSDYDLGYNAGVADQKLLLTSTTFTANGTYENENGWSGVTVDISLINNQPKSVVLTTADTAVTVTYDSGYTGLESVEITRDYSLKNRTNLGTFTENGDHGVVLDDYTKEVSFKVMVDSAGTYTQGYNDGYADGQSDGYASGTTDGAEAQKALLSSITITDANTAVTSQNGWSAITVNVPQTGMTGTEIRLTQQRQTERITDFGTYYFVYDQNTPTKELKIYPNYHITGDTGYVTAVYNVTVTQSETRILSHASSSEIIAMSIDGGPEIYPTTGYTFNTTGEHTIVYSVKNNEVYRSMFFNCLALKEVVLDQITAIALSAFQGSGLQSITFNDGVYEIGVGAFSYTGSLTQLVNLNTIVFSTGIFFYSGLQTFTMPANIDVVTTRFFGQCYNLTNINFGNVTRIDYRACNGCSALTSVNIPETVEYIDDEAFGFCESLNTIYSDAVLAPGLGSDVFSYISSSGTLYIPTGSDYSTWVSQLPSGWSVVEQ